MYVHVHVCYVKGVDSDHPWIFLRKLRCKLCVAIPWIVFCNPRLKYVRLQKPCTTVVDMDLFIDKPPFWLVVITPTCT